MPLQRKVPFYFEIMAAKSAKVKLCAKKLHNAWNSANSDYGVFVPLQRKVPFYFEIMAAKSAKVKLCVIQMISVVFLYFDMAQSAAP